MGENPRPAHTNCNTMRFSKAYRFYGFYHGSVMVNKTAVSCLMLFDIKQSTVSLA